LACEDTRRTANLIQLINEKQLFNFEKELVIREVTHFIKEMDDETNLFLKEEKMAYYR
jgi:hypothetical protein